MVTETGQTALRDGLRILAHMIARAYLKDMRSRQSELMNAGEKEGGMKQARRMSKKEMEVNDANKRSE